MRRKLTKHGRARFIERVGYLEDEEILQTALFGKPGFTFVWQAKNGFLWLVTVIKNQKENYHGKESLEKC